MELAGFMAYGVTVLTVASIYAITALGLNVQYGMTGQINIGIAGFFAVGAYTSAVLTTTASNSSSYVGIAGLELPFVVGVAGAMATSALVAVGIGWVTMRLRSDYLAIATIGIAEIIRLVFTNEEWIGNGVRGVPSIPRPNIASPFGSDSTYLLDGRDPLQWLIVVLCFVALSYWLCQRARVAPWGRVLRAIRENEDGVMAAGKDVARFRLQAFVFGSSLMGMAGALYAHDKMFISPEAFLPLFATFIVWVMLIAGGAGNNLGALLGAYVIWLLSSGTQFLTDELGAEYATQAGALRVLLIGVLLQVILIARPQGLLPEYGDRGR